MKPNYSIFYFHTSSCYLRHSCFIVIESFWEVFMFSYGFQVYMKNTFISVVFYSVKEQFYLEQGDKYKYLNNR